MIKLKKIPVNKKESDGPEISSYNKSYHPSLNLNSDQVPEIKDWEVGDTYHLMIEVKQDSKSENKDKSVNASFSIISYKAMGEKGDMESMSDTDMEKMQGMAMSNH